MYRKTILYASSFKKEISLAELHYFLCFSLLCSFIWFSAHEIRDLFGGQDISKSKRRFY